MPIQIRFLQNESGLTESDTKRAVKTRIYDKNQIESGVHMLFQLPVHLAKKTFRTVSSNCGSVFSYRDNKNSIKIESIRTPQQFHASTRSGTMASERRPYVTMSANDLCLSKAFSHLQPIICIGLSPAGDEEPRDRHGSSFEHENRTSGSVLPCLGYMFVSCQSPRKFKRQQKHRIIRYRRPVREKDRADRSI